MLTEEQSRLVERVRAAAARHGKTIFDVLDDPRHIDLQVAEFEDIEKRLKELDLNKKNTMAAIEKGSPLAAQVMQNKPKAANASLSRYRMAGEKEKQLKAQQRELEASLKAQLATAQPELKANMAKFDRMCAEEANLQEKLAELMRKLGFVSKEEEAMAKQRADMLRQKQQLEAKEREVAMEYDRQFQEQVARESPNISKDRDTQHIPDDIRKSPMWMTVPRKDISARDYMRRIEFQQEQGNAEFNDIQNLYLYSKNQERVVHMQREAGGKWMFATYYKQCSFEAAIELFRQVKGKPVSELPEAPAGKDEYVTTHIVA